MWYFSQTDLIKIMVPISASVTFMKSCLYALSSLHKQKLFCEVHVKVLLNLFLINLNYYVFILCSENF